MNARRLERPDARRPPSSEFTAVQRQVSPRSRARSARLALSVQRIHQDDGGVEAVKDQSVFYVYALKAPRVSPARPFYIGKGAGTRAWDHELRIDQSAKGERIRQVHAAGLQVLTVKLVEGLAEAEALRIEAELISAFGTEDR